ncbi:hypothetical protein [Desulfovibrio aminophilus]
MDAIKRHLQHLLNPLHLFCRLRQAGISGALALRLCRVYEIGLYKVFLG